MQFDAQVETATLWYAGCCNLNMQSNFFFLLIMWKIRNNYWIIDQMKWNTSYLAKYMNEKEESLF